METLKPELVSPAGDWSSLYSAVEAGCDAVYFGTKGMNMRAAAGNFDLLELKKVMRSLHEKSVKGYLTINTIAFDREMDKAKRILDEARSCGVDAVILWDMGILRLAAETGLDIHLSTQASVSNMEAVRFYASLGVKRIVLARECTLEDIRGIIKGIRDEGLGVSLETFIHGAMCVSISGRCFMSQEIFGRSANRGECLQPCRREYFIIDPDDKCRYLLGRDYVLSPRDLCTVAFIDELIEAGIGAFKIEGRMRPPEYVGAVTSSYRKAIDAYYDGKLDAVLKSELEAGLESVYNREFSEGFFRGTAPEDLGAWKGTSGHEKIFLGKVVKFYGRINVAEIKVTTRDLRRGDEIMIYGKNTPASFTTAEELQIEHESVEVACQGQSVGVKLPFSARPNDKVFILRPKQAV